MIAQLEADASLAEPDRLRDRLEALDRLDAYFPIPLQPAGGAGRFGVELGRRAKAIRDRLEIVNTALYGGIRREIQCGLRPSELLRCGRSSLGKSNLDLPAGGMGYDHLDELVSGVLPFEEPVDAHIGRESETMFYQPTPARHVFRLMELTALTADDVLVDIGSGLGHVPLLVSICTEARSVGVEFEAAYVDCARQCVRSLNLDGVSFVHEDARVADLSSGTVFYLYTPFMGSILSAVLGRLRREASDRRIRICCYGPCTPVVAGESWLAAMCAPDPGRITVFCSRS
jgi:Histone methylation protein DOT1